MHKPANKATIDGMWHDPSFVCAARFMSSESHLLHQTALLIVLCRLLLFLHPKALLGVQRQAQGTV